MKRTLFITFWASMFLTNSTLAGDVDDIKAAEIDFRAQESAGNVEGYFAYKAPAYTIFPPTNGMLSEGQGVERAKARFNNGDQREMQLRNIDVQLYGNVAVSTYYLVSTTRPPGGEPQRRHLRMTGIWAKQQGEWKVVHRHESALSLRSTPRIEERFVGTWKFVSIEFRGPDGEPRTAPDFKNGLLIYTPTGEISLQLMRDAREEFAAGRPTPEEAQAGILSYFAYFGTFTVDEAEGTVIHHRQAHLMLTTPPIMDGIIQTLTWERVE